MTAFFATIAVIALFGWWVCVRGIKQLNGKLESAALENSSLRDDWFWADKERNHFRDRFNEIGPKLTDLRQRAKKLNLGDTRGDGEFRFNDEPDPSNIPPLPHWQRPPVDSFAP